MEFIPLINGARFSWANIRMNIFGRTYEGFTAISYDDVVKKTNNYGAGRMPVNRTRGNYEPKCSITLYDYEVQAIQSGLPKGKRLQDINPFDITVSYVDDNGIAVTDVIRNCEFTNNVRDIKQGDIKIEVKLELIVSHIDWHQ
jgi:hypothetical protein